MKNPIILLYKHQTYLFILAVALGSVVTFSGIVRWQSRIATEAAQINLPIPIQQGEQIETDDTGEVTVEFPNVSLVKISPNSKIDFAQTLPVNIVVVQSKSVLLAKLL